MHSRIRTLILLLAVLMLATPVLKGEDASSVLSILPVPQGAKVIKTLSAHGDRDRTLMFTVQDESSGTKDWILKELKKQSWAISDENLKSGGDTVLNAQKSGFRLNVSFNQSGPTVLITYAVFQSASSTVK
jgi:hypothetical protein